MEHPRTRTLVCLLAAIDFFSLIEGLTALPELNEERIAGGRHGPLAPVSRHQQCVLVYPGHLLLRPGQHESSSNELACFQVKLAQSFSILASRRKACQAQAVAWIETGHS